MRDRQVTAGSATLRRQRHTTDRKLACVDPTHSRQRGRQPAWQIQDARGLMANRSAALAGTTTVRGMNRASFSREKDQTRGRAIRHHLWAPFAGRTLTVWCRESGGNVRSDWIESGKVCWNIGSETHTCDHHAQPRFRPQCMHPDAGARLTCSVACLGRVESRLHAEMYGKALRRKAICGSDRSTALRSHRACSHRIAPISSCLGIYACPYLRSNPGWLRGEGSGSRGSLGGLE